MSINFSDEISRFQTALEEKRRSLKELEEFRDAHAVQTRKAREALQDLLAVLRGELPPSERGGKRTVRGISAVPVNDDTGRPARGARRQQIIDICRQLGESGAEFRTAEVLGILRKVEDDISTGLRSYTYTIMNSLEKEGLVERQGRGRWSWKG